MYPVHLLCTDVRPSQDHQILCMQTVRINLARIEKSQYVSIKIEIGNAQENLTGGPPVGQMFTQSCGIWF